MGRRLRDRSLAATLALACALFAAVCGRAAAATDPAPTDPHFIKPALETFRPPKKAPLAPPAASPQDVNGLWWLIVTPVALTQAGGNERPPFTPVGAALFWHRIEMDNAGTPIPDAAVMCRPMGPRVLTSPFPEQVFQTPNTIDFIFGEDHITQRVHMNARHPKNLAPSYMGHSIGRWDGDTLVIDTVGFNDKTWLDAGGTPHSTQLHLIQRLKKVEGGQKLAEQVTVIDPIMFTRPWTYELQFEWRPDGTIDEIICEANMHDAQMQMANKDWSIEDARRSLTP